MKVININISTFLSCNQSEGTLLGTLLIRLYCKTMWSLSWQGQMSWDVVSYEGSTGPFNREVGSGQVSAYPGQIVVTFSCDLVNTRYNYLGVNQSTLQRISLLNWALDKPFCQANLQPYQNQTFSRATHLQRQDM